MSQSSRRKALAACALTVAAAMQLVSPPVAAGGWPSPYVYHRVGEAEGRKVVLEAETAYGTRDSRFFGRKGFEQLLRALVYPAAFVGIEAQAGLLIQEGDSAGAASLKLLLNLIRQDRSLFDLQLGAGYVHDYRGADLPFFEFMAGKTIGPFDLRTTVRMEIPLAEGRDEVDIMTGLAASAGLADWARLGIEVGLEDIEGFWEREEAEGGAKVVAGPTGWLELGSGFSIKANTSFVYAHLYNQVARTVPRFGFMGRLVLAYGF
ncbi:MAG: hypothetical protein D6806_16845 [Deltaproteobacteria bacterium]|nr:MAG: hypothetical protein D6806_16845 [Deltaproteobacteria bacterium]